jgi:hypothetical protein
MAKILVVCIDDMVAVAIADGQATDEGVGVLLVCLLRRSEEGQGDGEQRVEGNGLDRHD